MPEGYYGRKGTTAFFWISATANSYSNSPSLRSYPEARGIHLGHLALLLEYGADPNGRYHAEQSLGGTLCLQAAEVDPTPLMVLANRDEVTPNALAACQMLLDAGADPHEALESDAYRARLFLPNGAPGRRRFCCMHGMVSRDRAMHDWTDGLGPRNASAFSLAVHRGHLAMVKAMLAHAPVTSKSRGDGEAGELDMPLLQVSASLFKAPLYEMDSWKTIREQISGF